MLRMDTSNPTTDDLCQQMRASNVKRRLTDVACGEKAVVVVRFIDELGECHFSLPLCRECLGKMTQEMVSVLTFF